MPERVSVYHGSIADASRIRAHGFDPPRVPTWVSRDLSAAQNAISPRFRVDLLVDLRPDCGIIEARIPLADFDRLLLPAERAYAGFGGAGLASTEIVLRTPEQIALFNAHVVR